MLCAYLRAVGQPARWRVCVEGEPGLAGPGILCLWHSDLLLAPAISGRFPGAAALISRSRDGALACAVLERLGHQAIRASRAKPGKRNKGGMEGLTEMAAHLQAGGWLAIAPDGPRGPAERCSPAIAQLARFTGAPVRCLGFARRGTLRLDSWDRLAVPAPWGRGAAVIGPVLRLERRADAGACAAFTRTVEQGLQAARAQARALLGEAA